MKASWRRLFAIEEIERSSYLQSVYWVLLIGFFLTFNEWIASGTLTAQAVTAQRHVCLPYFQNCTGLYFLEGWPRSYDQGLFYSGLTTLLALSAVAAFYRNWVWAHALMVPALAWKLLVVGVLSY